MNCSRSPGRFQRVKLLSSKPLDGAWDVVLLGQERQPDPFSCPKQVVVLRGGKGMGKDGTVGLRICA